MDKKRGFLNVFFSMFFKIIIMVLALYSRKYIIKYLGNELNGLTSLYTSIITALSVVELGIGSAITFSMYKPIVQENDKKVAALYNLYKKLYQIVGIIILILGILLSPFLPFIAKDYTVSLFDIYFGYVFYLLSTIITYFFSAKISLINAYKNNYITSIINSSCQILLYVIQIISLVIFKSFIIFCSIKIITGLLNYFLISCVINKKYKRIVITEEKINEEEKINIKKNIFAMFFHKIGAELVNTSDNILISAFLGVTILGVYSNYSSLIISMNALLTLIFSSLTSIVGHFYISRSKKEVEKYLYFFHTLNFIIGVVFYLGYYSIIDLFILNFYSSNENLILDRNIPLIITISYFIQYFRKSILLFRDATGTFYNDRYLPLIEGTFNIILSILLLKYLGLFGIILATIITNILINGIFEPYILYKNIFDASGNKFIIKNYFYIGLFVFIILIFDKINFIPQTNDMWNLFFNGLFSILISVLIILLVFIIDKNFREFFLVIIKKIFKRRD